MRLSLNKLGGRNFIIHPSRAEQNLKAGNVVQIGRADFVVANVARLKKFVNAFDALLQNVSQVSRANKMRFFFIRRNVAFLQVAAAKLCL